uniref:Uncharacterized protein n=1 Tax=Oryza barthii TaxID=65489 RepID=A0A0D3F428_9ORYZ
MAHSGLCGGGELMPVRRRPTLVLLHAQRSRDGQASTSRGPREAGARPVQDNGKDATERAGELMPRVATTASSSYG